MLSDLQVKIIQWLLILGMAVVVIGTPIWYFNKKVSEAHALGVTVGKQECQAAHDAADKLAMEAREDQLRKEALEAVALQTKLAKTEKNFNDTRQKLAEELQKNPPPTTCVISRVATDGLRHLSDGAFNDEQGKPVSGPLDSEMSRDPAVPGQAATRHGG